MKLILALSYSSKWEIMKALRTIAIDVETERISSAEITEDLFNSYLDTAPYPNPELLIRTGGEHRISILFTLANCIRRTIFYRKTLARFQTGRFL